MHFSIPVTEEVYEDPINRKGQHTSYQIHLNGGYLCSIRFSRFLDFHENLKKEYDAALIGPFPDKKLLSLTPEQLEVRRAGLERYLQTISQEPVITTGLLFIEFMKGLLKEQHISARGVELPIYLANGNRIFLQCLTSDQTDDIFEAICREIELPAELTYYFGLFIIETEGSLSGRIVRKLQDFECPFKALQQAKRRSILQFRKAYWCKELDDQVLALDVGDVALNVLYIQLANDMKAGHFHASPEEAQQLQTLKKSGDRKGFLKRARAMNNYGQLSFRPATCNYPTSSSSEGSVAVVFGALKFIANNNEELVFPVQRIKSWKIQEMEDTFQLSIHFLRAKDDLVWIDIKTPHGIFISMCIQSIVDEVVRLRKGERIRLPSDRHSDRVGLIVKVEPSEETLKELEATQLTPHVPPTPTSPNAVAIHQPSTPSTLDAILDKVANLFTFRQHSTDQPAPGPQLQPLTADHSDDNQGFSAISDGDL